MQNSIRGVILVIAAIAVSSAYALGIVITELHRDPEVGHKNAVPGGYSHVFVELANFGPDTFFLKDIFLTNGKAVDSITLFSAPIAEHKECVFDAAYIPPGRLAVILPQNYTAGLEVAPSSIHPIAPKTIMLTVNRGNLCGGVANDDGFALYRGTRSRIDSLIYVAANAGVYISAPLSGKIPLTVKQPKGSSIVPTALLLNGSENTKYVVSSKEPLNPGKYEPLLNGVYVEYSANMVSATARCSIAGVFAYNGYESASWLFYSQAASINNDVGRTKIDAGTFNGQREFLLTFDVAPEARQYVFEINFAGSTLPFVIDLSSIWAYGGALRITEIYPKGGTAAAAGQPEWFELQNVSQANVNMNGWVFGNSKDTVAITTSDFMLPSGEFLVVCKDDAAMRRKYRSISYLIKPTRWHTLNSFNDTLTVLSPRGVEIDRAVYRNEWFSGWTSQSLERVLFGDKSGDNEASWTLCYSPTPGLPGSARLWRAVTQPSLEIGPTPFRPNGSGVDGALAIRMKVPSNTKANIKIFGFDGKLLKTFSGEREVTYWDGKTDKGRAAPIGAIYVVAEFTSGAERKIIRKNGVLWR